MRILGLCASLFIAGSGWRTAQARFSPKPLQVHGQALNFERFQPESADSLEGNTPQAEHATKVLKKAKLTGAINPNMATESQLQSLPGVGPALASRIVSARSERPFRKLEDLDRVKGIGPAKLEKLRPHLIF